jgi:hypothetical protein
MQDRPNWHFTLMRLKAQEYAEGHDPEEIVSDLLGAGVFGTHAEARAFLDKAAASPSGSQMSSAICFIAVSAFLAFGVYRWISQEGLALNLGMGAALAFIGFLCAFSFMLLLQETLVAFGVLRRRWIMRGAGV